MPLCIQAQTENSLNSDVIVYFRTDHLEEILSSRVSHVNWKWTRLTSGNETLRSLTVMGAGFCKIGGGSCYMKAKNPLLYLPKLLYNGDIPDIQ